MSSRTALALAAAAAIALSSMPLHAAKDAPEDLVLVRAGTLPIILTAPHGGTAAIPGVSPRDVQGKKAGGAGYVADRDPETDRLAIGIAAEIKAITGKEPYLVVARFHRKFVDPNRPPEIAYDQPAAKPYYDHYHESVLRFVEEVRGRYPAGVLIDVHGQHKIADSLVRGTLNGRSVTRLIGRAGFDAITGPKGLFGELEANGFKVFPSNGLPPHRNYEDGGFNGGYTTATYGSHRADGIDAVQFEFGSQYRKKAELDATIRKAARAIVAFHDAYLK